MVMSLAKHINIAYPDITFYCPSIEEAIIVKYICYIMWVITAVYTSNILIYCCQPYLLLSTSNRTIMVVYFNSDSVSDSN